MFIIHNTQRTYRTTHAYAQVDIMAYFEICELDPSGEYVPAAVHHGDATETGGVFLLQQGVQRRLRITLVYEAGSETHWTRVNELVIGGSYVPLYAAITIATFVT